METLFRWRKKYSFVFGYNLGRFTLLPARRDLKKNNAFNNAFNGGNIIIYYQIQCPYIPH